MEASAFKIPEWKRTAYAFDYKGPQIPKLGLTTNQLIFIAWLKQLHRRVWQTGKTLIAHADGEHRSWKSIKIAELGVLLDSTFLPNFNNRVVHTPKDFLDEVQRINDNKIYGAFIQVDEAGASINKQDYYEEFAKAINESIQILGYLHVIIVFVSPIRGFILSSLQKMTNLYLHFERNSNEYCYVIPYNLKYNSIKKAEFPKHPKIRLFGMKYKLMKLKWGTAPAFIVQKYQELELLRKPPLLAKMREKGLESEIREKKRDIEQLIELVVQNPNDYASKSSTSENPIMDRFRIKGKLQISTGDATYIKSEAEDRLLKKVIK